MSGKCSSCDAECGNELGLFRAHVRKLLEGVMIDETHPRWKEYGVKFSELMAGLLPQGNGLVA